MMDLTSGTLRLKVLMKRMFCLRKYFSPEQKHLEEKTTGNEFWTRLPEYPELRLTSNVLPRKFFLLEGKHPEGKTSGGEFWAKTFGDSPEAELRLVP